MRILHTADWHLGARLIERDRLAEHAAFLDWLVDVLRAERIDALLISGDIFDAANPPQDAVTLYYEFIRRLAELRSVRCIITGGNHDSASHLNAPRELLRRFDVHVFGHASCADTAVVDFGDAVIAAVPFLRERDLRQAAAGEGIAEVHAQLRAAIQAHYAAQLAACREVAAGRPVIAMGHLTVMGAAASESERDIHIGNLGAVGADTFAGFDYVALGHLHRPQLVAGQNHVRYSGSPIALSFSEAGDAKSVCLLDIDKGGLQRVETLVVPSSRALVRAKVARATLNADLAAVRDCSWVEVTVTLDAHEADLDRLVREAAGGRFEVLKVLAELPGDEQSVWQHQGPTLHELQPREVFRERLKSAGLTEDDAELTAAFAELLALHEAQTTA